jgi:DNA repair exonuclease SbcCD nuclease subunit
MSMSKYLVAGDTHFRRSVPEARLDRDDEWIGVQMQALRWFGNLSLEREASRIFTGDIFDSSNEPLSIMDAVAGEILYGTSLSIIPGNHDLRHHTQVRRTSYGMLERVLEQVRSDIDGTEWTLTNLNEPCQGWEELIGGEDMKILIIHTLTWKTEKQRPHPDAGGITADELLDRYPDVKWIFTGDNHQAFHHERDGRHVINPGCFLRHKANEIDYTPTVFLVDLDTEGVEAVSVPDPSGKITDAHRRGKEERDERLQAVIDKVRDGNAVSFSFTDNVTDALRDKKVSPEVRKEVEEIMEVIR